MDITIIICTRDRSQRLANVLRSLLNQEVSDDLSWEVVVVDNGSSDSTPQVVQEFAEETGGRVGYALEERIGKSFALNRGIEMAAGDILLFTDDDVGLGPGWIQALWNTFATTDCAGAGGKILPVFEDGGLAWLKQARFFPFRFDLGPDRVRLNRSPFGANMAFRRTAIEKYGTFRTDLGPTGNNPMGRGEDTELSARMMDAGATLLYEPEAVVFHPIETQKLHPDYLRNWYFNYGRFLMRRKPYPRDVSFFGIPRYLVRLLIERIAKWQFTFDREERFYQRLLVARVLGQIAEARKDAKRGVLAPGAEPYAADGSSHEIMNFEDSNEGGVR